MLRLVSVGNSLPYSWPVDVSATFTPGNIAQLTASGNAVVCTVSNGTAPIGIIDDIKTKAFTAVSWDETVIVPATGVLQLNGIQIYHQIVSFPFQLVFN